MVVSNGITRGYLRPGFARSPPLLLIALILITGISVFNYWNLSAQYSDVVKEISELQEHLRIITGKHENAEKLTESLRKSLRDNEDQLGKLKVNFQEKSIKLNDAEKKLRAKTDDLLRIETDFKVLEEKSKTNTKDNTVAKSTLQHDVEQLKAENNILKEKNSVLQNTLAELKVKMSSVMNHQQDFKMPPIQSLNKHSEMAKESGDIKNHFIKDVNETEEVTLNETEKNEEEDQRLQLTDIETVNGTKTSVNQSFANGRTLENSIQGGEVRQSAFDLKVNPNPIVNALKNSLRKATTATPAISTPTTQKSTLKVEYSTRLLSSPATVPVPKLKGES